MVTDYSRQMEVFDPNKFNTPVNIIGAGAIGSWVALFLAKLGVKNINVWDFDTVGEHNIPNQAFNLNQIGMSKVEALYKLIYESTRVQLNVYNKKFDIENDRLKGITFMCVDSMKARKEIYYESLKNKQTSKLLIETRMDLEGGYLYVIDPTNPFHQDKYKGTLYSDSEAHVSACGASRTVVATAVQLSSMAVWSFLNYVNGEAQYGEVQTSSQYNTPIYNQY